MIYVTYDEYDKLCEELPKLKLERGYWFPQMTELEAMQSAGLEHFLGFLVWILETEPRKVSDREKEIMNCINQMILSNVHFYDGEPMPQKEISIVEYLKVDTAAGTISLPTIGKWAPTQKDMDILENPFCMGFKLWLIRSKKGNETVDRLRAGMEEKDKNYKKFSSITYSFHSMAFQCKNWLPTEEQIQNIIIPNIAICFDFVLWILETCRVNTMEDEKVVTQLIGVVNENSALF